MFYPEDLLSCQNADGGWGYHGGDSWTEPTCYALLALAGNQASSQAIRRGMVWMARCRRPDGGMAPRESVAESTWLAALALLLPSGVYDAEGRRAAGNWLVAQTGRESGWLFRLR